MKVWYSSKTLWFNVVTFILGVLALTEFKGIIPITWTPYIGFINAVGNLILRMFFTTQPIAFR